MNILIHLLKIIGLMITIYPGIIIMAETHNSKMKRLKGNVQYTVALITVTVVDCLLFRCGLELICVICGAVITIACEFIFNEKENINQGKIKYEIKSVMLPIFVMIMCPVFEEYIYRFFLYKYIMEITNFKWIFCLISFFSFLFCHLSTQKLKALNKIPFSILTIFVFLWFKNIYICIVIHMIYNIFVYNHNMNIYINSKIKGIK